MSATTAKTGAGWLPAAGVLSVAGQLTALAFMLHPTPYTTMAFVGVGGPLVLLAVVIFGWVTWREAKARAAGVAEVTFPAGQVIFRQGERGDCAYVINRGEVDVLREDAQGAATVVGRMGPGEYFGEMALLTDAPRTATVRAATEVAALRIHEGAFHSLYSNVPALRASVEDLRRRRTAF